MLYHPEILRILSREVYRLGGIMQSLSGFARKYAIMEELDSGFGAGHTPEAFVRLDSWEGRIQASLHVKGLKQGPYTYKLYLIFAKHDQLIPLVAGSLSSSYNGMQNGLEIDAETMGKHGLKPDNIRFAAITAENKEKKWVPLFSSFEKSYKWDESIRQLILKKPVTEDKPQTQLSVEIKPQPAIERRTEETKPPMLSLVQNPPESQPEKNPPQPVKAVPQPVPSNPQPAMDASTHVQTPAEGMQNPGTHSNPQAYAPVPQKDERGQSIEANANPVQSNPAIQTSTQRMFPQDLPYNRCDMRKLEESLKNHFEECTPFKRASRGYSWYRVSDLAKLSNIMYMSGVNVPVFANPKILVGLFKYKHILAGLYHGDNGAHYYVIGVPAKNETDNRPFETACRWVPVSDSTIRDMGGYWLVYVSLKSGEIVV